MGSRTLFMLTFKKSVIVLLLLPFLVFGLFMLNRVPVEYIDIAVNAIIAYVVFILIALLVAFFVGWLEYFRYGIFINENDLQVARGLIATEEIGIPYKHIQDVKLKRSLVDQIFGVSDIIISISGSDSEGSHEEDTVVLPCLSKETAQEVQGLLLKKAQVEQIHILGAPKS